jgi:hypothetical protein
MTAAPRTFWVKCAMLASFSLLLTPAAAQAEDCVPITDAEELAAMGFGPDAEVNDCTYEASPRSKRPTRQRLTRRSRR